MENSLNPPKKFLKLGFLKNMFLDQNFDPKMWNKGIFEEISSRRVDPWKNFSKHIHKKFETDAKCFEIFSTSKISINSCKTLRKPLKFMIFEDFPKGVPLGKSQKIINRPRGARKWTWIWNNRFGWKFRKSPKIHGMEPWI